jgi:hypothetical protein
MLAALASFTLSAPFTVSMCLFNTCIFIVEPCLVQAFLVRHCEPETYQLLLLATSREAMGSQNWATQGKATSKLKK